MNDIIISENEKKCWLVLQPIFGNF
jgi:hypothetical protein